MAAEFIENHPYDEIRVGQSAELQRTLTRDDIVLFGKVSGDLNPTHVDPEFARGSAAGEITGHSLWSSGLISSLLGVDARGYRDRLDQHPCCLNIVDFKDPVRARLMLFNDVSHYENVPERILTAHLSKWWDRPNTSS